MISQIKTSLFGAATVGMRKMDTAVRSIRMGLRRAVAVLLKNNWDLSFLAPTEKLILLSDFGATEDAYAYSTPYWWNMARGYNWIKNSLLFGQLLHICVLIRKIKKWKSDAQVCPCNMLLSNILWTAFENLFNGSWGLEEILKLFWWKNFHYHFLSFEMSQLLWGNLKGIVAAGYEVICFDFFTKFK